MHLIALIALSGPAAQAATVTVASETCYDLDAGEVAEEGPFDCSEQGDIRWTYNGGPPAFQPLFWNETYADVGYVPRPFDAVTTLDLEGLAFCDYLGAPVPQCDASIHDRPWDPARTAIVRTGQGNLYRIRWLAFDTNAAEVTFEYAEIPEASRPSVLRFTQQGRLLDTTGQPIEGERALQIALHATAADTGAVWSKAFAGTPFADGFFSVTLTGDDDEGRSLDAVPGSELWMSFAVDGVAIGDRQRISMVPAAARAHGAALVDASQPCSVVGGLGFDTASSSLMLCLDGAWQRVALGDRDEPACPEGSVPLGSKCIAPNLRANDYWDDALTDCMDEGMRLCSASEMTVACKQRDALSLAMPDTQWLWLDGRTIDVWTNVQWAETHHVFRRVGTGCFNRTNGYQNSGHNVSWEWGSSQLPYYCCADPN